MIHFCDKILNFYQFDQPHHNLNKLYAGKLTYNQLFVDETLHVLNTKSGKIYTNTIDLDKVELLKLYNWYHNSGGRFSTKKDGQTVRIHELVYGYKTNANWVINHIDGDPSNNKRSNLEVVTQWFNILIQKKSSGLPIGATYNNGSYITQIAMPRVNGKHINFCYKDLNYLQNLHYQFGVKSGLVTPERYLQEVPNWLPDPNIVFTAEHQSKLEQLIETHLENQATWDKPIML
jgi:hypothetical protein